MHLLFIRTQRSHVVQSGEARRRKAKSKKETALSTPQSQLTKIADVSKTNSVKRAFTATVKKRQWKVNKTTVTTIMDVTNDSRYY